MKRALLIGINEYSNPNNNLRWCVNDIRGIGSKLIDCGYEVITIENDAATKEMIFEQIRKLKEWSKGNSEPLIYFSGHGWYRDNIQGIVAHDCLIADYELKLALSGMKGYLRLFFDSCFAGDSYKQLAYSHLGDKQINISHDLKDIQDFNRLKEGFKKVKKDGFNGAVFMASQSYETSQESAIVEHGYFTYAILQHLNENIITAYQKVRNMVNKYNVNQNPRLDIVGCDLVAFKKITVI
jgi:hypothetical protein